MTDRVLLERLTRELVDKGLLIEAGWVSLRIAAGLIDAPKIQLEEMRGAFFAGAQHLFASIMSTLDPDAEPTEKDLERMDKIHRELETFIADYSKRHNLDHRYDH
jgi:hypothetical protein